MTLIDVNISTIGPLTNATNMEHVESDFVWDGEAWTNATLPEDMVFGEAQIISITVYSLLFVVSSVLNLNVLANLLLARKNVGLSRLNTLLLQLVLADLSVSSGLELISKKIRFHNHVCVNNSDNQIQR